MRLPILLADTATRLKYDFDASPNVDAGSSRTIAVKLRIRRAGACKSWAAE